MAEEPYFSIAETMLTFYRRKICPLIFYARNQSRGICLKCKLPLSSENPETDCRYIPRI